MSSHIPIMPLLDPVNFGWTRNNKILEPVFMTAASIPTDIRQLMNIFCKDKLCQDNKCVCLKEGLKCCSDCSCKNCQNNVPALDDDEEEENI